MFKQRQKHIKPSEGPSYRLGVEQAPCDPGGITVASTPRSLLAARQRRHSALTSCLHLKQSARKWGLLAVRRGIMTPVFPAEGGGGRRRGGRGRGGLFWGRRPGGEKMH